jgi:hypothetical protein
MYYLDPVTGQRTTRSTQQTDEAEARKVAAEWEAALRTQRSGSPAGTDGTAVAELPEPERVDLAYRNHESIDVAPELAWL